MVKIIEPSITGQLANEDEQTVDGDLGNVLEEVYRSTEKPTFHRIANKRRNIFGKIPKPEPDSGDLTTTEQSLPVRDTSKVQKFGRIPKTPAVAKSSKPSQEQHAFGRLPQPISKEIRAPVQDLAENDPDLPQLFMRIAKPLDPENGDLVIAPRDDQSSGASSLSKSPEPENLPILTTSRVQKFGRISKTQAAAKSSKPSRERHVFGRLPQPISKKIRAPVQDLADNDPDLSQLFKKVAKPLPLDTENDDLVIAPRVDQSSGVLSISKSPEPTFASASKKSFSFQRISKVSKSSHRLKSPASRPSITAKETTSHRTQPILERSIKPAQSQLSSNPTQAQLSSNPAQSQ